ncbi:MAG: dihydrolipoyl dehydrogenase [Thermoplasmataceae archaeon]
MKYDVIIIGSGPGGYSAAIRLGQKGKSVLMIEKDKVGGECLNYGCIPSKALIELASNIGYLKTMPGVRLNYNIDMTTWQNWKWSMINRLTSGIETLCIAYKIRVVKGTAMILDKSHVQVGVETYQCDHLIIATGSYSVKLDKFNDVLYSKEILDVKAIPKELIVIGGGYIGIELGTAFAKLGSMVTIIELLPNILEGVDPELIKPVDRRLKDLGIRVMTSAKVAGVDKRDRFYVKMESGANLTADLVLLTAGRKPNVEGFGLENLKLEMENGFIKTDKRKMTSEANVWAVGDVSGMPMLAHKAFYEGGIVANNISGINSQVDYYAMPYVIYSDPEIAYTGRKTENGTKFPIVANGRAMGMNSSLGHISIYFDKDGSVVGGGFVAPHASELISEISLAIESGLTVEDLGSTIHPHPTISEAVKESAEIAYDKPLHFKPNR